MSSSSGSAPARFRFDLDDVDSAEADLDLVVRRIERPRFTPPPAFSSSVSDVRPELDSEPELHFGAQGTRGAAPAPGDAEYDAEGDEPPIDLPTDLGEEQPLAPDARRRPRELLNSVRAALRRGAPPRPSLPRSASEPVRLGRRASDVVPPLRAPRASGGGHRRLLGPLAALAALGLAYLVSTSSLVALAPRLAKTAPRVPDLGTLGSTEKSAPTPSSTGPSSPVAAAPAVPEKERAPVVETGPMPEGLSYPGKGLIEVVTSERELIYVDSIFLGRGPLRRVPVLPGDHAIQIRSGGTERSIQATVQVAQTTRVHFEADPHFVRPDGSPASLEELD